MIKPSINFELLGNTRFPSVSYEAGATIFFQGDPADFMYVIRKGEVEIERDGKIVEQLSPGDIFGEMALVDGSPRAATAHARTACELAPIAEKAFVFLVHETLFFALTVMRTLAERLRRWPPK